jgi:hypothetical protein
MNITLTGIVKITMEGREDLLGFFNPKNAFVS